MVKKNLSKQIQRLKSKRKAMIKVLYYRIVNLSQVSMCVNGKGRYVIQVGMDEKYKTKNPEKAILKYWKIIKKLSKKANSNEK